MAARTTVSNIQTHNTAADFRAWAQIVHDGLAFCGLVQTADTGQINLATTTQPTVAQQSMGYEIWRWADALQATAPLFLKIEYGSGLDSNPGENRMPGFWLTLGSGTDGAGLLTGRFTSRIQVHMGIYDPAIVNRNHYESGDGSRFAMAKWRNPTSDKYNLAFGVERTKDGAGVDTNEGAYLWVYNPGNGNRWVLNPLIFAVGATQAPQQGGLTPMNGGDVAANDAGNVGTHAIAPASRRGSENPLATLLGYWQTDIANDTQIVVNVYGVDHTFMALGGSSAATGEFGIGAYGNAIVNSSMAAMRYD